MKQMKKIADTIKKYSFFDPFPTTDYFALIVHKSNNQRLFDAIIELNEESKKVLLQLNDEIKKSAGKEDLGDTERLLRIFINEARDFKARESEWDKVLATKCERHPSQGRRIFRNRDEELELGALRRYAQRIGG
ncbi:hypothetical protein ACOIPX_005054 [Salmonella enterica]|uniref:Uncharacterized protein n=1 Tax=Salmonella enterica TaxID=28901 RepID=A0A750HKY1_SALER|nr:hypothetical protein [Salmonella enterica subsp. enterica serovar Newport]HAF6259531.1 hypothetical protein [Salmonella enterica]HAG5257458.1 hypothetical protein [Salmonella enterica]HDI1194565.1 hypothetical protein [Salmonella enterica]